MCGLIGIVGPVADRMTDDQCRQRVEWLRHRGPDDRGWARWQGVFMGHTRLAIQDTSFAAHQPFAYGNITLTYNGELWNADEFWVQPRRTSSDTEVVAAMLDRDSDGIHRDKVLDALDGMWAVAWHDARDGKVRLARDRWGRVPLYWATDGASIYWASEYKALPLGLRGQAIEPGSCLTVDPAGTVLEETHWAQHHAPTTYPAEPAAVRELLRRGVMERLVGDRPIAFLLSGGLDSSLALALAVEQGWPDPVAYTAVLDPASHDLVAARKVAAHFGVKLVEVPVRSVDPQAIWEAVRAIEIPMKAQVEIALAHLPLMQQMQADGFAVCLSGEAADELFGGYGGMCIKAANMNDNEYRALKLSYVEKMARGNFSRVNKVGMRYGIECRLPFMQRELVDLALQASKAQSPPAKKLLKEAARPLLPQEIIHRTKETFQGGTGVAAAAAALVGTSPVAFYNDIARRLFGYIPRS